MSFLPHRMKPCCNSHHTTRPSALSLVSISISPSFNLPASSPIPRALCIKNNQLLHTIFSHHTHTHVCFIDSRAGKGYNSTMQFTHRSPLSNSHGRCSLAGPLDILHLTPPYRPTSPTHLPSTIPITILPFTSISLSLSTFSIPLHYHTHHPSHCLSL